MPQQCVREDKTSTPRASDKLVQSPPQAGAVQPLTPTSDKLVQAPPQAGAVAEDGIPQGAVAAGHEPPFIIGQRRPDSLEQGMWLLTVVRSLDGCDMGDEYPSLSAGRID